MTSHDTALEAAAKAVHDHWQNAPNGRPWLETCDRLPQLADDFRAKARLAISAYISTLSPDASGLVERLRGGVQMQEHRWPGNDGSDFYPAIAEAEKDMSEAADALTALSLQLAAVE